MYQMVNWTFIVQGLLIVGHTFVLYLLPFTFLLTAYWFVFFKLQASRLRVTICANTLGVSFYDRTALRMHSAGCLQGWRWVMSGNRSLRSVAEVPLRPADVNHSGCCC